MKHVIGKRIKTLFVILIINFVILSVPLVFINNSSENLIVNELAKNAMNTASTAANFIEMDIEPYRELISVPAYTSGNYDEEYYRSMLTLFQKLKKETGASFIFTEKKVGEDKIQYILDGEKPGSDNFSPIGSEDTMGDIELEAFNEGRILATDMIKDPVWGNYLTGFAPIVDQKNHTVISLVGVDFSRDYVHGLIKKVRITISICFYIIAAFSSLVMYIIMIQKYKTFERDQLTNLFSKRFFDQQIVRIMERSKWIKKPFSLVMIDIDDFKCINDNYGHIAGDDILRSVGALIKKHLRYADLCFRYGGDELVLVLPDTEIVEAQQICERINAVIRGMAFDIGDNKIKITMSMGLVQWDGRMDINTLVGCADKEMYISKKAGKDRVSVLEEGQSTE